MSSSVPAHQPSTDAIDDLIARYDGVRRATEALAAGLCPEDCAAQSMTDASPVAWHLAYRSGRFATFVLEAAAERYRHFNPNRTRATRRPGNLVEFGHFRPVPTLARGNRPAGLHGDVWEWTQRPYTPNPGYRTPSRAIDACNGKLMGNQLMLRGGSCATPTSPIRATYRNVFPPDARWQLSGIRLARDS
jgi:formylglycine-generating enzyme required for sulfatase activity